MTRAGIESHSVYCTHCRRRIQGCLGMYGPEGAEQAVRRVAPEGRERPPGTVLEGVQHGTHWAYMRGCRCDDCRDAAAAYRRQYRARESARKRQEAHA